MTNEQSGDVNNKTFIPYSVLQQIDTIIEKTEDPSIDSSLYEYGYYNMRSSREICDILGITVYQLAKALLQHSTGLASYRKGVATAHLDSNKALINISLDPNHNSQFQAIKYLQQARYVEDEDKASNQQRAIIAKKNRAASLKKHSDTTELAMKRIVLTATEEELSILASSEETPGE